MRLAFIIFAVILFHLALVWFIFLRPADPSVRPPETETEHEEEAAEDEDYKEAPATVKQAMDYSGFNQPSLALSGEAADLIDDCKAGILIDWTNRRILWEKNSEEPVPIASMAKKMTVLLMMEAIEDDPNLSLDTEVDVTRSAANVGGRQVWLDPRETFTLDQLLKIIMMHSANDAAFLVAEFIGEGEADKFIEQMNQRAEELAMTSASFVNPHGLDGGSEDSANRASPREIAWLAALLLDFPRVVERASTWISSIRDEDPRFNRFQLVNTNRLVRSYEGTDGMKTGYTNLSGFCLAATCRRDGRRLIAVVTGCPSSSRRNDLVKALFDWGWQQ